MLLTNIKTEIYPSRHRWATLSANRYPSTYTPAVQSSLGPLVCAMVRLVQYLHEICPQYRPCSLGRSPGSRRSEWDSPCSQIRLE